MERGKETQLFWMVKFHGIEKMTRDLSKSESILGKAIIRNCHQKRQMSHQSLTLIQNQYQNVNAWQKDEANFLKEKLVRPRFLLLRTEWKGSAVVVELVCGELHYDQGEWDWADAEGGAHWKKRNLFAKETSCFCFGKDWVELVKGAPRLLILNQAVPVLYESRWQNFHLQLLLVSRFPFLH